MEANERGSQRQVWVGILVSVASLAAIFFFIKPAELWAALKTAQYGYLVFTVLGIVLFLFIRGVRWRFMLNNDPPYGRFSTFRILATC